MQIFNVVDLTKKYLIKVLANDYIDFEVAIQITAAERIKADIIITRNISVYKHSKIEILTPEDFFKNY